jgi:hypothetical protein
VEPCLHSSVYFHCILKAALSLYLLHNSGKVDRLRWYCDLYKTEQELLYMVPLLGRPERRTGISEKYTLRMLG